MIVLDPDGYFITGFDTEVGKTCINASLEQLFDETASIQLARGPE